MKTHQKIQHRSPLRKSPRFSSPSNYNSARPKPTPKTRPEDAWALSLHVAEQVPLRICYPSDEEDEPIRRSSRFTANKYKTPSPKISCPKPPYSSSPTQALTLRYGEDAPFSVKRRRIPEDREAMGRATKKTKLGLDEVMIPRRSYRLKGGKVGNSAPQLLALPEPGSKLTETCFLSEKHLRSRSVLMLKVEKVSTKVNSSIKYLLPPLVDQALVIAPKITVKGPVKSASNEKPRSVKLSAGNVKTTDSTELPKTSRNVRRGSQKDSGESSKQASHEKRAFSNEKRLKSRNFNMHSQEETLVTLSKISRSSLRRSRKNSGASSKIESKKSTFSSEECSSSRIGEMELEKESSETLPESSLRRSHKNSDESPEIKLKKSAFLGEKCELEKESLETLPEKSRSSLSKSCKNSGESLEIESKISSFSGEKCLSSRSVKMELEKESSEKIGYVMNEKRLLSPLIESVLDELFGVSEETDGEKSDSDAASEECIK